MSGYNLWCILGLWLATGATPIQPSAPPLTEPDSGFLSRVARRTAEQFVGEQSVYAPPYVPREMSGVSCHVIVTLRKDGRSLGRGASGPGPVVPTLIESTITAVQAAGRVVTLEKDDVGTLCVEIEAIGEDVVVPLGDAGLNPEVVEAAIEPGLDGFTIRADGLVRTISPAELALKNQSVVAVVKGMLESVGHVPRTAGLSKRRSVHWYQPTAMAPVVSLRRGMTLVPPESVTTESVDEAIASLANHLVQRQRSDGSFAFEYEPAAEAYSDRDDPVHHAGATWALAEVAKRVPGDAIKDAANRSMIRLERQAASLAGVEGASFVRTSDGEHASATTAQLVLAMLTASREAEKRDSLLAGLRWTQQSDGTFLTAFPPAKRLPHPDVYPSVTLLALVEAYEQRPNKDALAAFNRVFLAYQNRFSGRANVAAAAWAIRPFARMAVVSNRREFADFAFTIADQLVARQLNASNCRWPELRGGIVATDRLLPDVSTAICLSALVDAYHAARKFGDEGRMDAYRRASRSAARFVMQLRFRDVEAYFLRLPGDAVGGVRTSVADSRLRIDSVQHALLGLMAYRDRLLSAEGR